MHAGRALGDRHVKAGQADEAFEHLRQAIAVDAGIHEYIEKDEDLDSLREDPRFDQLRR